ncbi:MAG: hypothetical protein ACM31H_01720, partial [Nitrososphaerales archaeon]
YKNLGQLSRYSSSMKYPQYADAEITTLSASNNPKVKFQIHDAFPIALSDIKLDLRLTSDHIPTAITTFKFKDYSIIRV